MLLSKNPLWQGNWHFPFCTAKGSDIHDKITDSMKTGLSELRDLYHPVKFAEFCTWPCAVRQWPDFSVYPCTIPVINNPNILAVNYCFLPFWSFITIRINWECARLMILYASLTVGTARDLIFLSVLVYKTIVIQWGGGHHFLCVISLK